MTHTAYLKLYCFMQDYEKIEFLLKFPVIIVTGVVIMISKLLLSLYNSFIFLDLYHQFFYPNLRVTEFFSIFTTSCFFFTSLKLTRWILEILTNSFKKNNKLLHYRYQVTLSYLLLCQNMKNENVIAPDNF